eukprot:UN1107
MPPPHSSEPYHQLGPDELGDPASGPFFKERSMPGVDTNLANHLRQSTSHSFEHVMYRIAQGTMNHVTLMRGKTAHRSQVFRHCTIWGRNRFVTEWEIQSTKSETPQGKEASPPVADAADSHDLWGPSLLPRRRRPFTINPQPVNADVSSLRRPETERQGTCACEAVGQEAAQSASNSSQMACPQSL